MTIKTLKTRLQNPFVLAFQGFIVGTILFWTTAPGESAAARIAPAATAAATSVAG
jgi:hypothetical protein